MHEGRTIRYKQSTGRVWWYNIAYLDFRDSCAVCNTLYCSWLYYYGDVDISSSAGIEAGLS